jgi:hypothetical protein
MYRQERHRASASAPALLFVLLAGCGGGEHAPFLEDNESRAASSKEGGVKAAARDGGGVRGPVDAKTEEPPSTGEPAQDGPVSGAMAFDSGEVYVFGTLVEGTTGREVIARVDKPDEYVLGFVHGTLGSRAQLRHGQLLYTIAYVPGIRTFVPDATSSLPAEQVQYPPEPEANDPITGTPPCEAGVDGDRPFRTSPDGRLIYLCRDGVWYENGSEFFAPDPTEEILALGFDGLLLLTSSVVVNALGGARHSMQVAISGFRTARAVKAGFRVVMHSEAESEELALWQIDVDGQATRVDVFPPVLGFSPRQSELSGDVLYQQGVDAEGNDMVVRRTFDAEAETVYTEADEPLVKMFYATDPRLIPHDSSIFVVR